MARLHLRFKNIKPKTITATRALFEAGPWSGTDEEKQGKYELWLREVSAAYGIPTPTLEINFDNRYATYEWGRITLASWSVTTLFHDFRHHLQAMGACAADMQDCDDAQAWACSLFYSVKPRMFRRRVREGRIMGVDADDLLTTATIEARQQEMYSDENGEAMVTIGGEPIDPSTGSHDSLRPEEDDEEESPAQVHDRSLPSATDEITSGEIQAQYGVSRSFVSTHAERMGGWRVGTDPRWHFNGQRVAEYMAAREASTRS